MSALRIIAAPPADGTRLAFLLAEDRLGHYPEFRKFFVQSFDLDRVGLATPGYVQVSSGGVYALVFTGRSGEAFPAGIEVHAVVPALEPLDEGQVDRDLWELLRWMMDGIGGDWSAETLEATGRLYRLAVAGG